MKQEEEEENEEEVEEEEKEEKKEKKEKKKMKITVTYFPTHSRDTDRKYIVIKVPST